MVLTVREMRTAELVACRVLLLAEGHIVAAATPTQLRQHGGATLRPASRFDGHYGRRRMRP